MTKKRTFMQLGIGLVAGILLGTVTDRAVHMFQVHSCLARALDETVEPVERVQAMRELVSDSGTYQHVKIFTGASFGYPSAVRAAAVFAMPDRDGSMSLPAALAEMAAYDPDPQVRTLAWRIFGWYAADASIITASFGVIKNLPQETDSELLQMKLHFLSALYGLDYPTLVNEVKEDGLASVCAKLQERRSEVMTSLEIYEPVLNVSILEEIQ